MRSPLHLLLFTCAILAAPAKARADEAIFQRLTGTFGDPYGKTFSCDGNREHVSFSEDRTRAFINSDTDYEDYLDEMRSKAAYTILAVDPTGVTMLLDGEERMTDAGDPVVWVMRPAVGIDGYCWGRTDWHPKRCEYLMLRCAADPLLG